MQIRACHPRCSDDQLDTMPHTQASMHRHAPPRRASNIEPSMQDTITMSRQCLDKLTENTSEFRLLDRHPDRVLFNDYNPKEENAENK